MKWRLLCVALLSIVCAIATAADNVYGNWRCTTNGDASEASTSSGSGALLGLLCLRSQNKCMYYLESSSQCKEGQAYPLLVNGDTSADKLTATCLVLGSGSGKINALVLSPMQNVVTLVSKGGNLGFAQPMINGQFLVFRFSLEGSQTALACATAYVSQKTGDEVL